MLIHFMNLNNLRTCYKHLYCRDNSIGEHFYHSLFSSPALGWKAHHVGTASFTDYNKVTHKKMSHGKGECVCVCVCAEHEIGGNSIPSALSKWWMCYDGPAPAHKHVTYSKTKETSFYCPCLGIFHEHAYNALCLSLFLCFILSLTANDRWRLCRSSKVIEDHGGFFTKEPYLLVFYTFVLRDSLLCQCIF